MHLFRGHEEQGIGLAALSVGQRAGSVTEGGWGGGA